MTGEQATPLPLVPDVPFPTDHQHETELSNQWRAALDRGDPRGMAELDLEKAHGQMVRRDACLTRLVRSVQVGKGEDVAFYARMHASFAHLMENEVDDAKRHLSEARHADRQREAER
jgi:hypothetical protein